MKLLATAALAALALAGCATENDGEGGGHAVGLRPAKPSIDDVNSIYSVTITSPVAIHFANTGTIPDINGDLQVDKNGIAGEVVTVPFPIEGICRGCNTIAIRSPENPNHLAIFDELGRFFCHIWLDKNGHIEMTNCQ